MSRRILVIDDDEAIRKLFLLTLESTRHQVDTVPSGEKGLEAAEKVKYDLIYLDLKMPGMDGVETLRELRKIDKDVPVYIITAFHPQYVNQLNSLTKDGLQFELLKKPIGSHELLAITEGTLEGPRQY